MSDWDFLYEMKDRGYSPEEIAAAAGSGVAPWEWEHISREWIDSQFEDEPHDHSYSVESGESFQSRDGFPLSVLEQAQIFQDLVDCAARHFANTGRYLQVWGELGEIYAEIKFGLCRHGTGRAGSDGTIAGKLVEVKTISPEKASDRVLVNVSADAKLTHCAEVKRTHLGEDGGLLAADVDPGAGSGDQGTGPTRGEHSRDRSADGLFTQHGAAVSA